MTDKVVEVSPYRPPADNQSSLDEVCAREVLVCGLVSGILVFPPLQVGCWELLVAIRRQLTLPEFSAGLGFVISIGLPLVVNSFLFLFLTPAICSGVCARFKSQRSIYGGWALTIGVVSILQFFILWSGFRFSGSFDSIGISLFATLLPAGLSLFMCVFLSQLRARLLQFLAPGLAWLVLVVWLMV